MVPHEEFVAEHTSALGGTPAAVLNLWLSKIAEPRNLSTLVRPVGWDNYCAGMTSVGLLIQAGPGSGGGTGAWRTKRSGCAA